MNLPRFTVITGPTASGKSITAIKLLLDALSSVPTTNIMSTENLRGIKHEKFRLENLFDYKNCIVHMVEAYNLYNYNEASRIDLQDNMTGFVNELEENHIRLIAETQEEGYIIPDIKHYISTVLNCHYNREKDCITTTVHNPKFRGPTMKLLRIENASQYHKYLPLLNSYSHYSLYDTKSILKLPKLPS